MTENLSEKNAAQKEDVSDEKLNGVPAANAPLHDNVDTAEAANDIHPEEDKEVSSVEESASEDTSTATDGVVYDVAPADK